MGQLLLAQLPQGQHWKHAADQLSPAAAAGTAQQLLLHWVEGRHQTDLDSLEPAAAAQHCCQLLAAPKWWLLQGEHRYSG